jgi:splicing factor U2AF 35 kDa subunit
MDFEEKKSSDVYGAEHLADIYGTEKDKVNCPFYWKIGACRHGERCTRNHNKPTISQTLVIPHMYQNPLTTTLMDASGNPIQFDETFLKNHAEDFFIDTWEEFVKYGSLEELQVCDNVCEHLAGNVYIKYSREEDAKDALTSLAGRFYGGRTMVPEFSPVTDFREARCKEYEQSICKRGGMCNFMHLKKVPYYLPFEIKSRSHNHGSKPQSEGRSRNYSPEKKRYRSRSPRERFERNRYRSKSPRNSFYDKKQRYNRSSRSPKRYEGKSENRYGGDIKSENKYESKYSDSKYGGESKYGDNKYESKYTPSSGDSKYESKYSDKYTPSGVDIKSENKYESKYSDSKYGGESKYENKYESKYIPSGDSKYERNKYSSGVNKFESKYGDNKYESKYGDKSENKYEKKYDNKFESKYEKSDEKYSKFNNTYKNY